MTTIVAPAPPPDLARPAAREPGWWAMLLFVATETALFTALLAAYFYVRVRSGGNWPQGGIGAPSLVRPAVMTGLLFVGSLPAVFSERAARRGELGQLRLLLLGLLALAVGYLVLSGWDMSLNLDRYTPHTNAYASLFYTITALHGAHVALGALLALWTLALAFTGRVTPARNLSVQNLALYWHFTNLSWLAVFASVYLSVAL